MSPAGVLAAPVRRASRYMPLEKLNFQTFAGQLNTTFTVQLEEGATLPLQLVDAKRGRIRRNRAEDGAAYESFSLLFAGPRETLLGQGNYQFAHGKIGQFEMFIVPVISRDPSTYRYEAVFNRPVQRSSQAKS